MVCNRYGRNCRQTIGSGSGVSTDYVLYVAAANQKPCNPSSHLLAFASHCELESVMDRYEWIKLYIQTECDLS